MEKEPTLALGISGDTHLPAVALRLCGGGARSGTEFRIHRQCRGEIDHTAPRQ